MKAAFVIPWYGENVAGGAETKCRRIAENFAQRGIDVEVLTTCAKDSYNWSDFYQEGVYEVNGVPVRRFKVRQRSSEAFDAVNYKLMNKILVSEAEEQIFIRENINSENLYNFIENNKQNYWLIFMPYMFGTTYYGSQIAPERSFLIPCLHDESYAYMSIYKQMFERVKKVIFLTQPELRLARKLYGEKKGNFVLGGGGVDTDVTYDAKRFRKKYGLKSDFILYVGRRDIGKSTPLLVNYFCEYKRRNRNDLKLVLIGSGHVEISGDSTNNIIDLGFVPTRDKYDAHAAATILCQPSMNESFSLAIMDSWVCGTPVLVNANCDVTRWHCVRSNGGLYYKDYYEFESCINLYLAKPSVAEKLAANGRKYVFANYRWDIITEKYRKLLGV